MGSEKISQLNLWHGNSSGNRPPRHLLVVNKKGLSSAPSSLESSAPRIVTTYRAPERCSLSYPTDAPQELDEKLQCMLAALSVDLESKTALQCAQKIDWKLAFAELEKGKPYPNIVLGMEMQK
ncbi:hypothetical protein OUZ56_032814 [Daphnia magna]|uniref:Uncharacterized protein n=1 Tax=Daphnia magna TaxID=35525 RepID=A0ABR0B9M2_9CRUS|nr:hypothetical protein OUZ56_032814 [Daphnia magna]